MSRLIHLLQSVIPAVLASHSCVRSLRDHPLNLSDDMLKALASNRGIIQICFVSSFVKETRPNPERERALAKIRAD